jgi:diacylglycerol kinase family enzyme
VPGGSGNGIAASAGIWTPDDAVHAILRGVVRPLDAATVVQPTSGTRMLAVLSVHYGLMSDLDIGTEHLRPLLGGERFTYGALRSLLWWTAHAGRVAYVTEANLAATRMQAMQQDTPAASKCAVLFACCHSCML